MSDHIPDIVHLFEEPGWMPCCRRHSLERDLWEGLTLDPALVTCPDMGEVTDAAA